MNEQVLISIDLIDPNPYQPRQVEDPEAVAEIAQSIKQNGLLQVPSARCVDGRYQLAFGHTRKAAFRLLCEQEGESWFKMPLILRDLTDLQMFEMGVIENIKRRDLNPIEQAEAMRRYMDEFKKTSKETGEFFGVSEETVRQKVRYLKLPDAVQSRMRDGEINENTARSLLQMQRVAAPEVVEKTVQRIKSNEDKAVPEEVIENVIEHLPNVVELHQGRIWPLEMKKFPNKLLPRMSEQAVGQYESQIDHLINPPACNACPFYTKMRGSHYCGMKVCFERKQIAWELHQLELASKNLGIKAYNKDEDGGYVTLVGYESTHKKLFTSRHSGLRLLAKSEGERYSGQWGFDGVNSDWVIVVATGTAIDKIETRSKGGRVGKKTEKEKAEMRMMKVYRARRKELLWAFTLVAKDIFEGVPVEAVKKLQAWKFIGVDERIPDEWLKGKNQSDQTKADFERRELVWCMLDGVCNFYHRQSMADILKKLKKYADEWKIKIPVGLTKLAEQIDADIQSAAAPKPSK